MKVSLFYSPAPRQIKQWELDLTLGATVAQAIEASGVLVQFSDLDLATLVVSIWSRKTHLSHVLHEGDRLEICRPLRVDPKTARRERFNKQGNKGKKGAGLFAKTRPGAKAGY